MLQDAGDMRMGSEEWAFRESRRGPSESNRPAAVSFGGVQRFGFQFADALTRFSMTSLQPPSWMKAECSSMDWKHRPHRSRQRILPPVAARKFRSTFFAYGLLYEDLPG